MSRLGKPGSVVGILSLLLSTLFLAPPVAAQQGATASPQLWALAATATIGSYTPGPTFTDAVGNTLSVGSIYTGQISGSPITGSFRFDGDFQRPAGAAVGEFWGTFVAADTAGNTLYGAASGTEVLDSLGNAMLSGQLQILGGTGLFAQAEGSGQLSGTLDVTPLDPFGPTWTWSLLTLGGTVSSVPPSTPGQIPGAGTPPSVPGVIYPAPVPPPSGVGSSPNLVPAPPAGAAVVIVPAPSVAGPGSTGTTTRPGNGWGDRNHEHTGPPGQQRGGGHGRSGHD